MKKAYIKPATEIMELDTEASMMAMFAPGDTGLGGTSWGGSAGSGIGNGSVEADGNRRRGEWGNLWAQN